MSIVKSVSLSQAEFPVKVTTLQNKAKKIFWKLVCYGESLSQFETWTTSAHPWHLGPFPEADQLSGQGWVVAPDHPARQGSGPSCRARVSTQATLAAKSKRRQRPQQLSAGGA